MEAKAIARYVRVSPRKARIVIDLIRGKSVPAAREILQFSDRAIAEVVAKTLNSAVANAENQHHVRPETLIVKAAFADEGPTLKRIRPRAKGSASRIRKRTSHITIIVAPVSYTHLACSAIRDRRTGRLRRSFHQACKRMRTRLSSNSRSRSFRISCLLYTSGQRRPVRGCGLRERGCGLLLRKDEHPCGG